ncbi:MAG: glycosyltransferase [Actinobacteria bacterium]|nr:glycosyltransferase [Actinomycetota bacterium]
MIPPLPKSWVPVVGEELKKPYFQALREFVEQEQEEHEVYPPEGDIFAAMQITPFDKVRVLLLADPARHFGDLATAEPPIVENLLVPFHRGEAAIGTVWAIAHSGATTFDAEDARRAGERRLERVGAREGGARARPALQQGHDVSMFLAGDAAALVRRDVVKFLRGVDPRLTCGAAERLRTFDRPVLLAWAREDRVFRIRLAERLREELPGIRCVIAGVPHPRRGDLAYREELAALARRLGVEDVVAFVGLVDPIADLYAAADMVINPARFNEAFGRVAVEALSAGCPVVAARVGATPEIVRDGREALLFPPQDDGALAAAVLRLWRDRGLREELVRGGRRRVETEFNEDFAVQAFGDVVERVLAARRPATVPVALASVR